MIQKFKIFMMTLFLVIWIRKYDQRQDFDDDNQSSLLKNQINDQVIVLFSFDKRIFSLDFEKKII